MLLVFFYKGLVMRLTASVTQLAIKRASSFGKTLFIGSHVESRQCSAGLG